MTGPNSWLSAEVMRALGWALIHSLWQCAALGALAALAMAFIRRPSVRYLAGVGALALMLAAPVATFLVLVKPATPVQVLRPLTASVLPVSPVPSASYPVAALATADRAFGAIAQAPRPFPVVDILPWLVAAWLSGVAVFSLRFAGGFLLLEHRRRTQSRSPSERVLALCLELQRRLGLDRAIQYLECGWVEAPAVIGWLRPAVLLPVFALTGLSEEQFKAVIAHELAHIRRHDWFVNLFQVLVETLLFYHPAMWWLNRRVRIERELCCDEIAVSLTGSRLEYARALAQMAEWKNVSLLAMAANRGPLTQRILHVLGRKPSGAGQRVAGLTGGVLFLAAALAAANLLFGIAYPVQMAEAKESMRTALVSSQNAVEHLARQVVLTAKDAASPTVAPGRMDAAADSKADALAVPSSDLSRVLPNQSLTTPNLAASNDPRPAQLSSNASPAAALDDQTAPLPRDPSGGPVQAASNAPPVTLPKLDTNAPYEMMECGFVASGVGSGFVEGRVTSSTTVQMPKLSCGGPGGGSFSAAGGGQDGVSGGAGVSFPMGPPCDGTHSIRSSIWGRYCPNVPWATMTVQLANPADASKMLLGKVVALRGDFFVITQNKVQYWGVQNARVLYVDPFDRQAANAPPATTPSDQPVTLASPAAPGPGTGPRTRTQPALECLLGVGGPLCRNLFERPLGPLGTIANCAKEHVSYEPSVPADYCPNGPLEAVDYLGTNAAGADVYEVQFRHSDAAYILSPSGPNGKIGQYWIKMGPLNGVIPSSLVRITSPARMTLYRRPAHWSDPSDRHASADQPPSATPLQAPNIVASVQRALAPSPASTASNETTTACHNSSVFGRVVSSKAITMQGFTCFKEQVGSAAPSVSPQDVALGECPLASTTDAHKAGCQWDVTLNVRLADPGDADKMRVGQLVRLGGNFALINRDQKQYLAVANARILFEDVFYRSAPGSYIPPFFQPNAGTGCCLGESSAPRIPSP